MTFIVKAHTWTKRGPAQMHKYFTDHMTGLGYKDCGYKWLLFEETIDPSTPAYFYITDLATGEITVEWVTQSELKILLNTKSYRKLP